MVSVILVRHGETEANRQRCFADSDDIPLTETGRAQAHELALLLAREYRPDVVLSSEFRRARQTGEILANVLGLTAETIPGIHERNFGCLKGQPYARMDEQRAGADIRTWAPTDGESLDDVAQRALAAINMVRERYAGLQVVVVCHGMVIQAICGESSVPPNCGVVELPD